MQRWFAEQGLPPSQRVQQRAYPGGAVLRRKIFVAGSAPDPDADTGGTQAFLVKDKPGMLVFVAAENPNATRGLLSQLFGAMLRWMPGS